jgi:uncharacterized protein YkwD
VRYLAPLFVSIFFAGIAAVGVSVAEPPAAQAAGGGEVTRCGGGKISLTAPEKKVFELHNRERAQRGLRSLCVHPALLKAAEAHSRDMVRRDYFSHYTRGTNKGPCERIRSYGYRYRYCAENICYDSTPERMFDAWMRSSGHRGNILSAKYREVGIGAAQKGSSNTTLTADFGTRF